MTPSLRIAFVPIARLTFDIPLATEITEIIRDQLQTAGFQLTGPANLVTDLAAAQTVAQNLTIETYDLLLILQATFADSTMLVTLAKATNTPILLWAIPEAATGGRLRLNSLCGVNLGGHALRLRGHHYTHIYTSPEDTAVIDTITTAAQAGRVYRRLSQTRLGLIGSHPAGMDTCHLDEPTLKQKLGVQVQAINLESIFARMPQVSTEQLTPLRQELAQKLPNLADLEAVPLQGTLQAFQVMKQVAQEEQLDGLAVRCWPEFFEEMNCAACGAMSLLNDSHIPASCEADINGTITQLILQELSGTATFDTDLVSVDEATNTAVLWHCGKAPLSMANPQRPTTGGIHSNRKVPLVMEFGLKPGRVTLARLSRANGHLRLVIGYGEIIDAPPSFSGTSGVCHFDKPVNQVLDTILSEGLEHHLALTYGDYTAPLYALAELLDISTLAL